MFLQKYMNSCVHWRLGGQLEIVLLDLCSWFDERSIAGFAIQRQVGSGELASIRPTPH